MTAERNGPADSGPVSRPKDGGAGAGARAAILGRIRANLAKGGASAAAGTTAGGQAAAVADRISSLETPHLLPERVQKDAAGLEALFKSHLRGQSATVIEVASEADVPAAVAGWLRQTNLPMRLRMGDDQRLGGLPWAKEPALTLEKGRAESTDEVGLSHAVAGVAETGTLVLASGPDNPVTVSFLPENHVVVLRAADIVGPYESAFDRIRRVFGRGAMPRTVNLISGPSRTGDIGGRLVMGAHGPRRMCVVVVKG
jgi:L-lactate dehydrogenase complex protein LldG